MKEYLLKSKVSMDLNMPLYGFKSVSTNVPEECLEEIGATRININMDTEIKRYLDKVIPYCKKESESLYPLLREEEGFETVYIKPEVRGDAVYIVLKVRLDEDSEKILDGIKHYFWGMLHEDCIEGEPMIQADIPGGIFEIYVTDTDSSCIEVEPV